MKPSKILVAALLLGACIVARPASAQDAQDGHEASDINLDFFYEHLQSQGDWLETEEYGYVFRPKVGAEKADWRPYADGYWAHTDEGWLWNSYEDFGWATYHYGRWTRLQDYGWVWVPGYDWAPAWVAWRGTSPDGGDTSDAPPPPNAPAEARINFIGWAPLPPEAKFEPAVGINTAVDYEYGLTPETYSFVPAASFGEPFLAPLIIAVVDAYAIWNATHPYTNITYVNYGWGRGVYAGGPRFVYYNAFAARRLNQYNIQRNTRFVVGGANNFRPGQPANGVIKVFAPRVAPLNAANRSAFKPAVVKAKVPPGQVRRGWEAAKGSPAQVAAAKSHAQRQAANAAPARIPPPQSRIVTPSPGTPKGGINAGLPNSVPSNPAVQRNQLSPQNAARVQANQAAKGLPAKLPTSAAPDPLMGQFPDNTSRRTPTDKTRPVTPVPISPAQPAGVRAAKDGQVPGASALQQTTIAKKSGDQPARAQKAARQLDSPTKVQTTQAQRAARKVDSQPAPQATQTGAANNSQVRSAAAKPKVRADAAQSQVGAANPKPQVRAATPQPQVAAPAPQPQARPIVPPARPVVPPPQVRVPTPPPPVTAAPLKAPKPTPTPAP